MSVLKNIFKFVCRFVRLVLILVATLVVIGLIGIGVIPAWVPFAVALGLLFLYLIKCWWNNLG